MSEAESLTTPLVDGTVTSPKTAPEPAPAPALVATGFTEDELAELEEETEVVKIFNQAFSGTANLANLLPTGSFLTFQILSPIVTNSGGCSNLAFTILTSVLLALCGSSAFILSLSDSFQATNGKVYYGLVMPYGLWSPFVKGGRIVSQKYALTLLDAVHAVLSMLVFATSTLLTENVRSCFYPDVPPLVYNLVPVTVGFFISLFFIFFPTTRHGIGYPVVAAIIR